MKLEIFKVGKHTSSSGVTKNYSVEDLNNIVSNHSEPTPITVGHPKTNSPAFGWINNLKVVGESLFAEATDLVPEFLDLVKQKIYKNRSVSLNHNEDGTLSLRHVAFLGGTMPAVKGLAELEFSGSTDEQIFEFELNIQLDEVIPKVEPVVEKNPQPETKVAEQSRSTKDFSEDITALQTSVQKISEFMETLQSPNGTEAVQELQSKIDELNLKIDVAYFQRNILDKLQLDNLTPAIKNKILALVGYFESLDFAEEEQTKVISDFQELAELIQPFQTEEVLKKVEFENKIKDSVNEFSAMETDKESMLLFNEATAYAKENEISFVDAIQILSNNNKVAE